MIDLLAGIFIKDKENYTDSAVRRAYDPQTKKQHNAFEGLSMRRAPQTVQPTTKEKSTRCSN